MEHQFSRGDRVRIHQADEEGEEKIPYGDGQIGTIGQALSLYPDLHLWEVRLDDDTITRTYAERYLSLEQPST